MWHVKSVEDKYIYIYTYAYIYENTHTHTSENTLCNTNQVHCSNIQGHTGYIGRLAGGPLNCCRFHWGRGIPEDPWCLDESGCGFMFYVGVVR